MIDLVLIGIGTGKPEHLTLQAVRELNAADLIIIPRKGSAKADLADLRREICETVITNPDVTIAEFDLPVRDPAITDYEARVNHWHDAIAQVWLDTIRVNGGNRVALLVWGDPSLYDSTLRIAGRLTDDLPHQVRVIPGITSVQALTAAHTIPINEINGPFTITTGRRLRDEGWPTGADTVVVMLDGECSFQTLDPTDIHIWWTAFAGMENEISLSGPLNKMSPTIIKTRAEARATHGWIMDIYLMRRPSSS